ncbi:unnamed protein product (macronuclear) [Paramecium tetraurelia]|uniref:MORN repeat protein n=1 Tax=Paramecium tetraurelia TaxID=5888 RepID=A0C3J8_PARTE|nr:uncharacterized protein GSPATT00034844001 [Paramecium tetraurelia]CAK65365.1 unnamed protein product [Paramecium tetraurelia]|eukprot:XP_001432762.1 hypothetical protein (macronuclear) [Paramecium tetraurelia strain d4-2]
MQLVRLTTKAHTPRNVPLRSPEKTQPITLQFPNYIFLGPTDNIKIVKFTKNILSSNIKQIRSNSPSKDQNISFSKQISESKTKHQKTSSVQIITQSPDLFVKLRSQNSTTNKLSNITALQTSSTKHKHHRSELTQDTCSEQPSTPTLTVPILKYVEHSGNMSQGQMFNKSNKLVGSITFQNGLYYVGEMVKFQDVLTIDGSGTLYTDNSKFYVVYEGRWKNNCFHGRGKYYNQYQIESSNDWHFNWKMIQAIFNKGEIIEGKIDFYLNEDSIAHQIEYSK